MFENFKINIVSIEHPENVGVFMKYFFQSADTGKLLNNLEVTISSGAQIAPHSHESSTEYFYVVSGEGKFLDNTEWRHIVKGDAFRAPKGMTHSIRNDSNEVLILFSTFAPPIK
jgi:mannose-6-phosphate isomerase-like protein (cupin superfamily)